MRIESNYTHNTNTQTKCFLVRLFEAIIAKISGLFDSILGKRATAKENVAPLTEKKIEQVDLSKEANKHKDILLVLEQILNLSPNNRIDSKFHSHYNRLSKQIQGEYAKFYRAKLNEKARTGRGYFHLKYKDIAPFFSGLCAKIESPNQ